MTTQEERRRKKRTQAPAGKTRSWRAVMVIDGWWTTFSPCTDDEWCSSAPAVAGQKEKIKPAMLVRWGKKLNCTNHGTKLVLNRYIIRIVHSGRRADGEKERHAVRGG